MKNKHRLIGLLSLMLSLLLILGAASDVALADVLDITDEEDDEELDSPWESETEAPAETAAPSGDGTFHIPDDLELNPDLPGKWAVVPPRLELANLEQTIKEWKNPETKDKNVKVKLNEIELELISGHLGCGIDVFKAYADPDSGKSPILDLERLIADGKVLRVFLDQVKDIYTEARSVKKFLEEFSLKIGVKGRYKIFSGSIDTYYNSINTGEEHYYYATQMYLHKVFDIYIQRNAEAELKAYLLPQAAEMLNNPNVSAEDLFSRYGHYVDLDSIVGGRADLSMYQRSTESTTFEQFSVKARAAASSFAAGIEVEVETGSSRQSSSSDTQIRGEITTVGGPGNTFSLQEYKEDRSVKSRWAAKNLERPALIGYGERSGDGIVPIWIFCEDSQRAAWLKSEFARLAEDRIVNYPEAMRYDYLTDLMFVHYKDSAKARDNVPSKFKIISNDADTDMYGWTSYLCGTYQSNPNRAISDLVIKKNPDQREYFNHRGAMRTFWGINALSDGHLDDNYKVDRDKNKDWRLMASWDKTGWYLLDVQVIDQDYEIRGEQLKYWADKGYEPICYSNSNTIADWNLGGDQYCYGFMKRTRERNED